MASSVKIAGSWRSLVACWVKVGGTWRAIPNAKTRVGGAWRTAKIMAGITGSFPSFGTVISPNASNNAVMTVVSGNPGSLKLNYVVNTGSPTVQYRINSGSWTTFASGTNVTLANGNTLQVQLFGASGTQVTFTFTDNTTGDSIAPFTGDVF